MNQELYQVMERRQKQCLKIGLGALSLSAIGAIFEPAQFFVSYLSGYLFWLGLALGCLGVNMLQHLTGGHWGFSTRRFLEAGFMTLPFMAALFLPVLFGMSYLYSWTHPAVMASDPALLRKVAYLNPAGFIWRAVLYFAVWLALAACLRKWSLQQDATNSPAPKIRLRTLSGPGMVLYPLTGTFAFVDWIMSIQPKWSSTIFPLIVLIGQILSAFALITILSVRLRNEPEFKRVATPKLFHDLSNLILAFVMFWTYISFAQLLIIYSGNVPREIAWYLPRIAGWWKAVVALLLLFHFVLPFFLLLFKRVKLQPQRLALIAGTVFCAHILESLWIVAPSFHPSGLHVSWLDFTTVIGLGGIWCAAFLWNLKRHPLLPVNDPATEPEITSLAHAK